MSPGWTDLNWSRREDLNLRPPGPETKGANWMAIERSWQPRWTQAQDYLFVLQVFSKMRLLVGVVDLSGMLSLLR